MFPGAREHTRPKPQRTLSPRRCGDPTAAVQTKGGGDVVVLRGHQHSVVNAVVLDEFPDAATTAGVPGFDLEVVAKVGVQFERFLERQNARACPAKSVALVLQEMIARVEAVKLGEGVFAYLAGPVRRALERFVVKADEVAVRGFVNVGFDVAITEVGGPLECELCVLGPTFRAAAVREGEGSGGAEVRASHRAHSIAPFGCLRARACPGAGLYSSFGPEGSCMARDLEGKVAIITGGASGIGKALAQEMAARGCHLVLADVDAETLEQTSVDLRAEGRQVEALTVDVREAAQVQELVEGAYRHLGRVDYLFNNAGINLCAELRDTSLEDWNWIIDVNLRGVVHGVHAAYPIMREQGFGHIVNTASAAALIPAAAEGAYAATKHAVLGLSEALRIEAESFGVNVSVVCPGLVDTPILETTKYVKLAPDAITNASPEKPMDPRQAARVILRGVERNRFYIVFSATLRTLWPLHRLAPDASLWLGRTAIARFRRSRREPG